MENEPNIQVHDQDEEEIDLLELFYYYMSRLPLIVGVFLLGALIAGLFTWRCITPKYTATAKMYMVSSSSGSVVDLTDLNIGTSLSDDYVELIQTRPIYEDVMKELKLDYEYKDFVKMIEIGTIDDTRILTISATSTDPQEATDIANALAYEAQGKLPNLMDTPSPTIAEEAVLPEKKSAPSLKKNTALGALGCTFIVLAVLTLLFLLDDTLKSAEDIEKEFGVMPLTVIPEADLGFGQEDAIKKSKKTGPMKSLFARK